MWKEVARLCTAQMWKVKEMRHFHDPQSVTKANPSVTKAWPSIPLKNSSFIQGWTYSECVTEGAQFKEAHTLRVGLLHGPKSGSLLNLSARNLTGVTLIPAPLAWTRVSSNPMGLPKSCELKVVCMQTPKFPITGLMTQGCQSSFLPAALFPAGIPSGPCLRGLRYRCNCLQPPGKLDPGLLIKDPQFWVLRS